MRNRAKLLAIYRWLIAIKPKDLVWKFKVVLLATILLYSFVFSLPIGILLLLTCLLLYHIPVFIVYCNQLGFFKPIPHTDSEEKQHELSGNKAPLYFIHNEELISTEVDDALALFLNTILEKFILSWHSQLETNEELFIYELRHALRFTVITLFKMFKQMDLSKFIVDHVIPTCIWHLDCYNSGLHSSLKGGVEQRVLFSFGEHLHSAAKSRKEEEHYLRHYSEELLKHVLPKQLRNSKILMTLLRDLMSCQILQNAMDSLADPDNINQFIILWLSEEPSSNLPHQVQCYVPMLEKFTAVPVSEPVNPIVVPTLASILKTPSQLYHWMQFLKRENTLKYLQFCFAVDEFNEKLLNPDLKPEQVVRLQMTAQKMFEIYVSRTSPDCIQFDNEFESQMRNIVYSRNPNDVILLRTSPILFKAYDHVMDILERQLMPMRFYRSPEFYHLICGWQQGGGSARNSKKKSQSLVAGWGAKIRSALRPSGWPLTDTRLLASNSSYPEEESAFDSCMDLTEADFIPDDMESEGDGAGAYADLIPICGRDLTAWRACIPRVVTAIDSAGKPIGAFEVDIQRIDLRPEDDPEEYHWSVIRTYQEFYNLESKLSEFHGEFLDIHLPPKKLFGTKNVEFLQTVRVEFECYLRTLLQQPALKGSDLIFSFLTLSDLSASHAIGDGGLVGSNLLPDLGLGRMIRHVPFKLRKERGQHLETFLQTFVASTEAPKPRPSKVEARDLSSEVSVPVIKELHPLFQDNAKSFLTDVKVQPDQRSLRHAIQYRLKFDGPYECLLYVAWKIWRVPQLVWSLLTGLQSAIGSFVDAWAHKYVQKKLERALQPPKVTLVIQLLHELVVDESKTRSRQVHEHRRAAWDAICQSIPDWVKHIFGVESRVELIFQCLQYPVLNKQLSYALLDLLLRQTCPEMFEEIGN